jgi:hypothetical protein
MNVRARDGIRIGQGVVIVASLPQVERVPAMSFAPQAGGAHARLALTRGRGAVSIEYRRVQQRHGVVIG